MTFMEFKIKIEEYHADYLQDILYKDTHACAIILAEKYDENYIFNMTEIDSVFSDPYDALVAAYNGGQYSEKGAFDPNKEYFYYESYSEIYSMDESDWELCIKDSFSHCVDEDLYGTISLFQEYEDELQKETLDKFHEWMEIFAPPEWQ